MARCLVWRPLLASPLPLFNDTQLFRLLATAALEPI
jgi:hypothetical protein